MNPSDQLTAIGQLRCDHEVIVAFLSGIEKACAAIELGDVDADRLVAIVDFVDSFIESFHHIREEDLLFAYLKKKRIRSERLGKRLTHDHEDGRHHVEAMRNSLPIDSHEKRTSFLWNARGYAALCAAHMKFEEDEVYPHIETLLSERDDQEIVELFVSQFPDQACRLSAARVFVSSINE